MPTFGTTHSHSAGVMDCGPCQYKQDIFERMKRKQSSKVPVLFLRCGKTETDVCDIFMLFIAVPVTFDDG